jgi:RNA polymerase sigma factor (sigma-70 family)
MSHFEMTAPAPARAPARQLSDAELVHGTGAEFGMLFDRYAPQLYRYCVHRVGPHLAEDVLAETFLIAYERRERYDPAQPRAVAWLYGIATNVAHRRRGAEARAHRALRSTDPAYGPDRAYGLDPADRAVERADAQALVRTLAGALGRLSRRHRDVLYLLAAGLEHDEIAAALGLPSGTVRSRLHRARTQLRHALDRAGLAQPTLARPDSGEPR